jgi:hypothetical protein
VIGDDELRARLSANALAERPHIGWDARARSLLSAIETALARNTAAVAFTNAYSLPHFSARLPVRNLSRGS